MKGNTNQIFCGLKVTFKTVEYWLRVEWKFPHFHSLSPKDSEQKDYKALFVFKYALFMSLSKS